MQNITKIHHRNTVRHGDGFFLIMCHIDECDSYPLLNSFQFQLHIFTELQVKSTQRFVEQQNFGMIDQSASKSNALPLSTGKLLGAAIPHFGELHQVQHLLHSIFDLPLGHFLHFQSEGDILCHRHVREKSITLKDGVDRALVRRLEPLHFSGDCNIPARGHLKATDHS